jgi:GDPmannose 4,6-dehydratase
MKKKAIIFGVNGQDGSYLSELLLSLDYEVIGVHRRSSVDILERVRDIKGLTLVEGDITDFNSVQNILKEHYADEVYNLAAQSHVGTSFKQPLLTTDINYVGVLNILEVIRNDRHMKDGTRFYQASTSEMFGANYTSKINTVWTPEKGSVTTTNRYQNENTPFAPRSPYAVAKLAAHHAVNTYRESYGLHASCGILFNHESPRRGEQFVTRKITKWVAEKFVNLGGRDNDVLKLGNIKAYRDWGHARDYVRAMWLMLQQENPGDYVVATGETHSVEEFVAIAFAKVGIGNWPDFVEIDPLLYRPAEVEYLCGDPTEAKLKLGWHPETSFEQLVTEMLNADVQKTKVKS